ncbi:MAG: outer membrane protein assembly factor BamB [Methylovulum sp.]|jgi:outer membrane protein assembly factor BamB|nr:outer membrane protein assembly factor BamB [Methylovulum sp.]TSA39018.1 MAG: outer membrane protein assembly factor BamB [Methylococcaceae bacterium]
MRLVILLYVLCLSGCAVFDSVGESFSGLTEYFGGDDVTDPPKALIEYPPEKTIDVIWEASVGVGTNQQSVNLVPAISSETIIAADRKGLVVARALANGNKLWERNTELPFSGGPGVGQGTLIIGTSDAEVVALHSETGAELWRAKVSSEVLSVPVIANGIVIIRSSDGNVVALNEKTGAKLWSYEVPVPALSIRGTGTPVLFEENVIGGYDNGKLMALRIKDGKFIWETSVAIPKGRSEVERLVDLDVNPLEAAGVIYNASFQGGVSATSAIDGEVIWRNESISSHSGISNDWRYLYLTDVESHVWQLDQRSGLSLWKQQDYHQRQLSSPAVFENYVIVGDFEGYVHCLSALDGRSLARRHVAGGAITAKPVIVGDLLFVYATDGTLAAVRVH